MVWDGLGWVWVRLVRVRVRVRMGWGKMGQGGVRCNGLSDGVCLDGVRN